MPWALVSEGVVLSWGNRVKVFFSSLGMILGGGFFWRSTVVYVNIDVSSGAISTPYNLLARSDSSAANNSLILALGANPLPGFMISTSSLDLLFLLLWVCGVRLCF